MKFTSVDHIMEIQEKKVPGGYALIPFHRTHQSIFPGKRTDFQNLIYLTSEKLWIKGLSISKPLRGLLDHQYLNIPDDPRKTIKIDDLSNQHYEYFGKHLYSYLCLYDEQGKIISKIEKSKNIDEIIRLIIIHPFFSHKIMSENNRAIEHLSFYDFLTKLFIQDDKQIKEIGIIGKTHLLKNLIYQSICHGLLFNEFESIDFNHPKELEKTQYDFLYLYLRQKIQNLKKSKLVWKILDNNLSIYGYLGDGESMLEIRSLDEQPCLLKIEHHLVKEMVLSRDAKISNNHVLVGPLGYALIKANITSFQEFYGKQ